MSLFSILRKLSLTTFCLLILYVVVSPTKVSAGWLTDISQDFLSNFSKSVDNTSVLPQVRYFLLDAQGQSLSGDSEKGLKGILMEMDENKKVINTWNIEYEPKGDSRRICRPRPINVKFLKTNKKEKLFPGASTYNDKDVLGYKKIRFTPDCDLWGDKSNPNFPPAQLREYFIFDIFKAFGVPVSEVVGFAQVYFTNFEEEESSYRVEENKAYPFVLLQRTNESGDQVPFPNQFMLDPSQYLEATSGTTLEGSGEESGDHFTTVGRDDIGKSFRLDPESTVRYYVLSDFVKSADHKLLWNEDYAPDIRTGLAKIIPYSFDMSIDCRLGADKNTLDIRSAIAKLSPSDQISYKKLYYKVAREIFDDPRSLERMLVSIDRYPFAGNKLAFSNYIKIHFYNTALYFSSKEFAGYVGVEYAPFVNETNYLEVAKNIDRVSGLNDSCEKKEKQSLKTYKKTSDDRPKAVETASVAFEPPSTLTRGTSYRIKWTAQNLTKIGILVKQDAGPSRGSTILSVTPSVGVDASVGEIVWSVPSTFPEGTYYFSAFPIPSTGREWKSGQFQVVSAPRAGNTTFVSIFNGSTIIQKGSTYPIEWYSYQTEPVTLKIKNNQTGTATTIATISGIPGKNTYRWTVPEKLPAGTYTAEIYERNGLVAESASSFRIAPVWPTISYIVPTSGPIGTEVSLYGNNFYLGDNKIVLTCGTASLYFLGTSNDGRSIKISLNTNYSLSGTCYISHDDNFGTNRVPFTFTLVPAPNSDTVSPTPTQSPTPTPTSSSSSSSSSSPSSVSQGTSRRSSVATVLYSFGDWLDSILWTY